MRQRRVDRCVLRAELALEAGFEEEARAALEEAQGLIAHSPDIDTLRNAVHRRQAFDKDQKRAIAGRRSARMAAAALLVLTVSSAAFWARSASPPVTVPQTEHTEPTRAAAVQSPVTVAAAAPAPSVVTQAVAATTGRESAPPRPPEPRPDPRRREPRQPAPRGPDPQLSRSMTVVSSAVDRAATDLSPAGNVEPAPSRLTPDPALPEAPGLPPIRPPAPAPPATVLPSTGPIGRLVEGVPTANVARDAGEPTVAAAPASEEPRVRAVLARYESAYTDLDAAEAQAVWPGADRRSLARAFDGLASQRVSLGRCSVAVTGATARADCNGSVTWTPKVGGGAQKAARQWRFDLANADGAWQITRAEVR